MSRFRFFHHFLFVSFLLFAVNQYSNADDNPELVSFLEDYQALMNTPPDQEESSDVSDVPFQTWRVITEAINKGYIRFTENPTNGSLVFGAKFSPSKTQELTYVAISSRLLSLRKTYPSTSFSILSGALREAFNFFKSPSEWGKIQSSILERFLMDMEGYRTQALLIKNRLLPQGYLLSPYDQYILDSYDKDGLLSVGMYMKNYSFPLAQGMYEALVEYEKSLNSKEYRSFILSMGEALLKKRNEFSKDADFEPILPVAIGIHTWLEFTPQMISRIHNRKKNKQPLSFDAVLAAEQDYTNLRRELETTRITDLPHINRIVSESMKGFESIN